MELFLLYIWLKLNALSGLLIAGAFIMLFFTIYHAEMAANSWHGKEFVDDMIKKRNISVKILLALVLSAIILPSKTDVAILVGANYALKAAETPEAQKVMSILRAKANEILDAEIKEKAK